MSSKFVRLYRYDPVNDPMARLRLEYQADFGTAILSDEDVHLEQVDNPEARHCDVRDAIDLTTACVRWLHRATGELLDKMEAADAKSNVLVDARKDDGATVLGLLQYIDYLRIALQSVAQRAGEAGVISAGEAWAYHDLLKLGPARHDSKAGDR